MKITAFDPEHPYRLATGTGMGSTVGGDLAGTMPNPDVTAVYGTSISSNVPTTIGDVLTILDTTVPLAGWATSSNAPASADYLVGTAHAGLSAEIVVGTTPGGELGGTWASPTVDAVHSGSAHHAQSHDHSAAGDGTTLAPVTLHIGATDVRLTRSAAGVAILDANGTASTPGILRLDGPAAGSEGGELQLYGAAAYTDWGIDNYQGLIRFYNGANVRLTLTPTGGIRTGGTTFPTSPETGEQFWRTDHGMWFYYDGTRWLSAHVYRALFSAFVNPVTANGEQGGIVAPQGHDIYVTAFYAITYIATPNDGTRYWTIQLRKDGASNIGSALSTVSNFEGTYVAESTSPNAVVTGALYLSVLFTKVGAVGDIYNGGGSLYGVEWRRIAT